MNYLIRSVSVEVQIDRYSSCEPGKFIDSGQGSACLFFSFFPLKEKRNSNRTLSSKLLTSQSSRLILYE
jgi:hypothetical protein